MEVKLSQAQLDQARKNKRILEWAEQKGVGAKTRAKSPLPKDARGFGVPHPGRSAKGGALTKKRLAKAPATLGALLKAKIDGQKGS